MRVDGRAIASDILREVRNVVEANGLRPVVRAIALAPSPATKSYLRIKKARAEEAGMLMDVVALPDNASASDIAHAIAASNASSIIVQLPIPEQFNTEKIVNLIPLAQDADVLSSRAYERFNSDEPDALIPPVAGAVKEVLERSGVDVMGRRTVVVGKGQLVGKPVAVVLGRMGAFVTVVSRQTPEKEKATLLGNADIIVSGAGAAHIITPDMVKDGVVLVDAGTSGVGGGVVGDIDPLCEAKSSLFTPVPGGIGPIAVSCLFRNTLALMRRLQNS